MRALTARVLLGFARGGAAQRRCVMVILHVKSGIFIRSFDEYMGQDMQTAAVWFASRPDDAPPLTVNTSQRRQPRRLKPCEIDPQQSAR